MLQDVVFLGGGDIHQRHTCLDPVLQVDVFVEVLRRPEIHQLHGGVDAADAVNAAKALDNAHRIPVDVIVDEVIAVLKVLPFGNTISGDEQVNFIFLRHGFHLVAVLRRLGEKLMRMWLKSALPNVVLHVDGATGDQRNMNAEFFSRPVMQDGIQIECRDRRTR